MSFNLNLKEYSNIQGETHLLDDSHLRKPQFEKITSWQVTMGFLNRSTQPGPLSASLSHSGIFQVYLLQKATIIPWADSTTETK